MKLDPIKRPVDIKRESAGSVDIGTETDGAIIEILDINGKAIVIKERAVYEWVFADTLDPKREYPDLPTTTQRLLLQLGTESELFSRVFITAKQLLRKEFLLQTVDVNAAIMQTLAYLSELSEMANEIHAYLSEEKQLISKYEDQKTQGADHYVPSISNIQTRCKTIFQKAHHALQEQLALIRLFYPDFGENLFYSKFHDFLETKYGSNDSFVDFIIKVKPFTELIRTIRNSLEHKKEGFSITNFELQLNNDILTPTIEVNDILPKTSLSTFLSSSIENMAVIFENLLAYLCSKSMKQSGIMGGQIKLVPEERRRNKHARFAYWSNLGEGGYFHQ